MTRVFVAREGMRSYFHRLTVFVWTGEKDLNTLPVNAYMFFFGKRRKSLLFKKYLDMSRPGLRKQTATAGKTSHKKWLRVRLNLSAIISISWR